MQYKTNNDIIHNIVRDKIVVLFVTFFFVVAAILAQRQGDGGMPYFPLSHQFIPEVNFAKPNIKLLRKEDKINDDKGYGPWRFGWNNECSITPDNSGIWIPLQGGGKIWLLKIVCEDAQTINLTFNNTLIPQGNALFVYDSNYASLLGKFTQKHIYQGQLGTELITGNTAIVEYYVSPENEQSNVAIEISIVTHGYRFWDEWQQKAFGGASFCHKNVNCPEANAYDLQKKSVVMIISGANGICSGTLVNNTAYDGKPYILTANHCYSSSHVSWVFRFNWEATSCDNPTSSPSFSSLSGAQLKARRSKSDFLLLEIMGGLENGTIPQSYDVYFAGWDRTGNIPEYTVSMHHPKGDIKKISFDDDPPEITQSSISGVMSDPLAVWKVVWDRGTSTESASSGGGLFDHNKRIIGQLWGGMASCTNSGTEADFFGRISSSWEPIDSDPSKQLKHWLDPNNTQALIIDGYDNNNIADKKVSLDILTQPKDVICETEISPTFKFSNLGTQTVSSATFAYGLNGEQNNTYEWSGSLTFLQNEEVVLPTIYNITQGAYSFLVKITHLNGEEFSSNTDSELTSQFVVMEDPQTITLEIGLDMYADETSWKLYNNDNVLLYKAPIYTEEDEENIYTYNFCLSEDCYRFVVYDEFSDGMAEGTAGFFKITNSDGSLLTEMTKEEANFGDSIVRIFCVGEGIEPPKPNPPIPEPPPIIDSTQPPTIDTSIVSINENKLFNINVYPNPTTDVIHWSLDDVMSVKVFDMQGNAIIPKMRVLNDKKLSVKHLTSGIYWMEIELINGTMLHEKIVMLH